VFRVSGGGTTDPPQPTGGALVSASSGRCLDVPQSSTSNGTQPVIWDCNGGTNQQWTLEAGGTVVSRSSGLCLDVNNNGTANGTTVLLWTCTGAAPDGSARPRYGTGRPAASSATVCAPIPGGGSSVQAAATARTCSWALVASPS
jgi:alpha-galactosidase